MKHKTKTTEEFKIENADGDWLCYVCCVLWYVQACIRSLWRTKACLSTGRHIQLVSLIHMQSLFVQLIQSPATSL